MTEKDDVDASNVIPPSGLKLASSEVNSLIMVEESLQSEIENGSHEESAINEDEQNQNKSTATLMDDSFHMKVPEKDVPVIAKVSHKPFAAGLSFQGLHLGGVKVGDMISSLAESRNLQKDKLEHEACEQNSFGSFFQSAFQTASSSLAKVKHDVSRSYEQALKENHNQQMNDAGGLMDVDGLWVPLDAHVENSSPDKKEADELSPCSQAEALKGAPPTPLTAERVDYPNVEEHQTVLAAQEERSDGVETEIRDLKAALKSREGQLETVQDLLVKAQEGVDEDLIRRLASLEEENCLLKGELVKQKELSSVNEELEGQLSKIKGEVSQKNMLLEKSRKLEAENSDLHLEGRALAKKLGTAEEKLRGRASMLKKMEAELDGVKRELAFSKAEAAQGKESSFELKRLQNLVSELEGKLRRSEAQLEENLEAKAEKRRVALLESQLARVEREKADILESQKSLRQQVEDAHDQALALTESCEARVETLENEVSSLRSQLLEADSSVARETAELEVRCRRAEERARAAEEERCKKEVQVSEVHARLEEACAEASRKGSALLTLEAEVRYLKVQVENLENRERKQKTAEEAQIKEGEKRMEEALRRMRSEFSSTERELEDRLCSEEECRRKAEISCRELSILVNQLRRELSTPAPESTGVATARERKLEEALKVKDREVEELREQTLRFEVSLQAIAQLQDQNDDLKEANQLLKSQIDQLLQ